MRADGEKFFTIWYGVYHAPTRVLRWSGGGHPAGLLFPGGAAPGSPPDQLDSQGPMIGMMPWPAFETGERSIPPGSRQYLSSDGAHEIHKADGTDWTYPEFVGAMTDLVVREPDAVMDGLTRLVRGQNQSDVLDDDFSMLEAQFG